MGHRDPSTTAIYSDYMPNEREVEMADRAFTHPLSDPSCQRRVNLSEAEVS